VAAATIESVEGISLAAILLNSAKLGSTSRYRDSFLRCSPFHLVIVSGALCPLKLVSGAVFVFHADLSD
jgi:hypothetical protein